MRFEPPEDRKRSRRGEHMAKQHRGYFICPHCGAKVAEGAAACRECGSDAESGWSRDADDWGAAASNGYGDEAEDDYDEFIEREFPGSATPTAGKIVRTWLIRVVVALLIGSFIIMFFGHGF